uniref:RAB32, member RAS oncogene family n=7 Tax=Aves TaxID=8782 RepID=A0A8C5NQT9_JUNHY
MQAGREHCHWNAAIATHPDKTLCPMGLCAAKHSLPDGGERTRVLSESSPGENFPAATTTGSKVPKNGTNRELTLPQPEPPSEAHPALPCRSQPGPPEAAAGELLPARPFPGVRERRGGRAAPSLRPSHRPPPGRYKPAEFPRPVTAVRWWLALPAPSHPLSRFVFPRPARAGPAGSRLGKVAVKVAAWESLEAGEPRPRQPGLSAALHGREGGMAGGAGAGSGVPECREHLFKVLVIGELGVGKTSIIKRYVHQLFSQHYRATIGVDFALKVINWDSKTLVRLQLWDIAGQERFGNMTRVYYKEAVGAFVVFDVTRGSTFEAVSKWKHDLDSKVLLPNGSPIPAVLLANKCDQKKDGSQNPSQMDQFCREGGFVGWFETSAKDNINIDEAARFLVENILANYKTFPNEENDVGKPKLDLDPLKAESKSQCC